MVKKKQNQIKWNPIPVEDPTFASEGLIAVEECVDYDLTALKTANDRKRKSKTSSDKPRKKKQKLAQIQPSVQCLKPSKSGSSVETEPDLERNEEWTRFGLQECLIKAVVSQGFDKPTPIQSLTLPAAILGRRDIVGAAETGSGKTLAFGLPILSGILTDKLKNPESKRLYALILTPTRELAIQVKNHLVAAAKFTDVKVAVVLGGMAAVKQERILGKSPEIVVATPGRLWELIQEGNSHLSQVDSLKFLAIDETDRMLEKGHFEELHSLLERLNLNKTHSENRQNFVFSATLSLVHDLPKYLKKSKKLTPEVKLQQIIKTLGIKNPKIVDITKDCAIPATLTESRISCAFEEKDYYIYYFLQRHPGRTLIFCNSIGCVKRLANLLSILNCKPLPLHASMQQRQRLKNLERFRDNANGILIATDVAARGLDIPNVEHVLHYQIPRTSEGYVHRSGRTARASQRGLTVLLMEPAEIQNYIKLCKTLEKSEDLPVFPVQEDYLKAVKERVNLGRELDQLELEVRKGNSEQGWLQKAAKEMDIIVDDFDKKYDDEEIAVKKKIASDKRKHLNALLSKPVFPKGFSGKYPLQVSDFASDQSTAVELVKNATSQKTIPLFKPRKQIKKK